MSGEADAAVPRFAAELARGYDRAAGWLLASCTVNDGGGSSAWRSRLLHPIRGWSHPYPETTGYLIPTFYESFDSETRHAPAMRRLIPALVEWLLSLQMPDGAFPGGHQAGPGAFYLSTRDYLLRRRRAPSPSIFNSAQILRGLVVHHRVTGDAATRVAIERCAAFLRNAVREDGTWGHDAYARGSSPAYFAFVVPPMLEAAAMLHDARLRDAAGRALRRIAGAADADGFIPSMGFAGAPRAHTHTIGYTLDGLLEGGRLLGVEGAACLDAARRALDRVLAIGERRKRLPGAFEPGWQGDWTYRCVTGDCQIALCHVTIHALDGDPRHLNAACRLYSAAAAALDRDGGLPGSRPLWGAYMRFRHPNWAPKFFMDLSLRLRRALHREWSAA